MLSITIIWKSFLLYREQGAVYQVLQNNLLKLFYFKYSTNYFITLDISSHVSFHHLRVANKSIVSVEIQVGVEDLKWNSDLPSPSVYLVG